MFHSRSCPKRSCDSIGVIVVVGVVVVVGIVVVVGVVAGIIIVVSDGGSGDGGGDGGRSGGGEEVSLIAFHSNKFCLP